MERGGVRCYWCYAGTLDHGTFVWEREWESMAEMEAAYAKLCADTEARAARARVPSLSEAGPIELYRPWD